MALRKIMEVEGEAFVITENGRFSLGVQKGAYTAYCKVVNINGNKENGRVSVECKGDGYLTVKQYDVPFSVAEDAPNFVKQTYVYLKTLPEWAGATDC